MSGPGELVFVPLGGAGEIGMNLSLYGYADKWLMVDCGIAFGDERTPGIDVMLPDISFIEAQRARLAGLVVTHAHEDHIGGVAYLWRRLRCPVYASPFAAALLQGKLEEAGLAGQVPVNGLRAGERAEIGPFSVEFIAAAHSIPEAHFTVLRCDAGTVVHATDWKLDPDPVVGHLTDEAALAKLADESPLALLSDSTNVFVPGRSGSEKALVPALTELIGKAKGRVAVTCFASNVARVATVAAAARANGRHVALVGRSLWHVVEAARRTGYLADLPPFLPDEEVGYLPPENVAMVVTGSQGEPRSALSRIAHDDHPNVVLEEGDTVIFSSRMIPGNELAIGRVHNALVRNGVHVITEHDAFVHVSGHPARDEIAWLYRQVRPRLVIPIHGETRHLHEQAQLARDCQMPAVLVAENGDLIRLWPEPAERVERVTSGRFGVDGTRLIALDGAVMRDRRRMRFGGAAAVTVVIDGAGKLLAEPALFFQGLLDDEEGDDSHIRDLALDVVAEAVRKLPATARRDDDEVSEAVRIALRRSLREALGKRPVVQVQVVRVAGGAARR